MKKLALMTSAAMCLVMASCSKEPLASENTAAGPVTVTASVPSGIAGTKAVPSAPENHQLRCILVVDYPTAEDTRLEQVADATGSNFLFTFTPQESGYTCLLWADYIDATASAAEGEYPDKYYDTQNLHNIGYVQTVLTDGSLFNNDACDAFYGTLAEGRTAVTLYRPFSRLTFKNEDGSAVEADALDISYSVHSGFDVLNGTAASTATISATDIAPAAEPGVWFYNYVFAPVNQNSLPEGNITLTKDSDEQKTIPTAEIPLDANADQGLTFTYGTSTEIEVGIEDEYGVSAPKVGDFFYSDGTWSASLDNEKTVVGVIFALSDGAASADNVSNYAGTSLTEIHGWVVGLKNLSPTPRFASAGGSGANVEGIEGVNTEETDICGYMNSAAWLENPLSNDGTYTALDAVASYGATYGAELTGETTSGWYLPAIGQLSALRTAYNSEGSAVKNALTSLNTAGTADLLNTETGNAAYYWSSTARSGEPNSVRLIGFDPSLENPLSTHTGGSGRNCRTVLTF